MPHAFVKTAITPDELVRIWQEKSCLFCDVRMRIQTGYLHAKQKKCLFPCLTMELANKQWFYIEVRQKFSNRLIVRLDPLNAVHRTFGVRLALTWFVREIAALDSNSDIYPGNLAQYFDLFHLDTDQQKVAVSQLRHKLRKQAKKAEYRNTARAFIISLDQYEPPLSWKQIFDNTNPVEVEIGPGKGKYLFNQAVEQPEHNFVAIEWAGRYFKRLTERLLYSNTGNVRLLFADARMIFQQWIAANSVAKLHIYYPDPWWKKRHEKYRLITTEFLQNVEQALSPGGLLSFVTDVQDLFEETVNLVSSTTILRILEKKVYRSHQELPLDRTNFEIKKWQSGSDIFEIHWKKEEQK